MKPQDASQRSLSTEKLEHDGKSFAPEEGEQMRKDFLAEIDMATVQRVQPQVLGRAFQGTLRASSACEGF